MNNNSIEVAIVIYFLGVFQIKKWYKLILIVVLLTTMITGCVEVGGSEPGGDGTGMFEINSDKITITTSDGIKIDITDENTMKKIGTMCKNYNWKEVPKEEQLKDACEIWIDFNNNRAVIGMYKDKDYGNLEKTKERIGTPKYLPNGLNSYIQELIKNNKK